MKKYISIAIMLSLMDHKTHTAKELAEKFEASVKTIYRSIDTLLQAGMPLLSVNGRNGGYKLIDQSKVTSEIFTNEELASLLSFVGANSDKFSNLNFSFFIDRIKSALDEKQATFLMQSSQEVIIDTDVWGSVSCFEKYREQIKKAISCSKKIDIMYSSEKSLRRIHPYALVYKVGSWYIYSFAEDKDDFRLFKLSRIKKIINTNNYFERKNINLLSKPWNRSFTESHEKITAKMLVKKEAISDLYDWLSDGMTIENELEHYFIVKAEICNSYGLLHRLMQFGNKVIIMSPLSLACELKKECEQIFSTYDKEYDLLIKNAF